MASETKFFYAHDGQIIRDIDSLPEALSRMSDETFSCHVNSEKNDFAEWIGIVYKDNKLSQLISNAKTKEQLMAILPKKQEKVKERHHYGDALDKAVWKIIGMLPSGIRAFAYRRYQIHHIIWAFENRYGALEKIIDGLQAAGIDTSDSTSQLFMLETKIRNFKNARDEKDGIDILHLFYKLEESTNLPKMKLDALLLAFEVEFLNLERKIHELKNKCYNADECEKVLTRLRVKLNSYRLTFSKTDSIAVLHAFYELQDAVKVACNQDKPIQEAKTPYVPR